MYDFEVDCTDSHKQVGMDKVIAPGSLGSVMVIPPFTRIAKSVGLNHVLGVIFPFLSNPPQNIHRTIQFQ